MKVILTAFQGKLKSEPIDWPDQSRSLREITMIMDIDNLKVFRTEDDAAVFDAVHSRGKFVPTGKYFVLDNNETAEEYKLIEVIK